jgi:hypothetical protein
MMLTDAYIVDKNRFMKFNYILNEWILKRLLELL